MKLSSRIVVWFQSLVVIGCFSLLSAQTKPGTYSVTDIKGSVTWTDPVTKAEAPVTDTASLPVGATINTGDASSAVVVFANGSTVLLNPNSSLEVAKFAQQTFSKEDLLDDSMEPSISKTELNLIKGQMLGNVRRLRTGSEYNINTPVGAAGIRGTTYTVTVDPVTKNVVIKTAEGRVVFIPKGNINKAVEVVGGSQLTVTPTTPPSSSDVKALDAGELQDILDQSKRQINTVIKLARKLATITGTTVTITVPDPDESSPMQPGATPTPVAP